MTEAVLDSLTDKKLLTRNIIWNYAAQGLPIFIAIFTIPPIIRGLGTDRFSLLTLVWSIIGYSSMFDLGLGRALTQLVSKKLGANDTKDIPTIIWTSLATITFLGILATILVCALAPFIVTKVIKVPGIYIHETILSFYALGLTLPLLIAVIALKGILEAYQKFAIVGLLRLPVVIFNYICPLLLIPFTQNLFYIVLLLVIGRIITFIAYFIACCTTIKGLAGKFHIDKAHIKPLLSFGGWITISNVINPIMTYMDRFLIACILSATIVSYYTTPFDIITKLTIIPTGIIGVMFPAFSAEYSRNRKKAKYLYFQSIKNISLLLVIPILCVILFAKTGLTIWLSPEFAEKGYRIAQLLAIGIFLYGINQSSLALIQACGRSDLTAKIDMVELPVYLISLFFFIKYFGLLGAAMATVIRYILDSILLHYFALKIMKD